MSALAIAPRWRQGFLRLIARPDFQRWAANFPLTRGVARRRAQKLFDICSGFVYSQILSACVELDLFARLAEGPRPLRALAAEMGLEASAAERLLRAAAALELVRAEGEQRYGLGELGAAMLGNPSISDFVRHHALLYADLADPVALLKGERGRLARFWPYAERKPGDPPATPGDAEDYAQYSALMARSQALIAEDVLDAFPPRGIRAWLDVGGGEGAFISALAARAPDLDLMLFDLPPVAARASESLGARVRVFGGDFLNDALPRGADVLSLVRILHDHDDESALALLRRTFAALAPGGRLLIAEPMAGTAGSETVGDAYFGFYLLAMGRGRARSPQEIETLLKQAGFARIRVLRTRRPMLASALVAEVV